METASRLRAPKLGAGIGALVELPALFIAFISAGFGHGDYILVRMLFPIPMLFTLLEGMIGPIAFTCALLQFPIYGWVVGRAYGWNDKRLLFSMGAIHFVAMIVCFSGALSNFE